MMSKQNLNLSILFLVLSLPIAVKAQSVFIPIESKSNVLVLKADLGSVPKIVYFGKRLNNKQEYSKIETQFKQGDDYSGVFNAAYTSSGAQNLVEPALAVIHADGNTSLDLHYVRHETKTLDNNVYLTKVLLKDPIYALEVTLNYKIYVDEDVIEQWTTIRHNEKSAITLSKYASANLYLKGDGYWLKQYHGDWAREMQPEESKLTHGIKVLDSKLGTRANLYQPPTFMVSLNKPAEEDQGDVLYGSMEWSGNFRIDLELDPLNNLRIIAGVNNHASAYQLKPNIDFTTPAFLFTFSSLGKGDASRKLQSWARKYRILDGSGSRLTLLNNWEATFFDFNEQKLARLLADTKKLGVDLFLLDDGWFGNKYPRNNDKAALGDWQENKEKLPNGIASLIEEANANGVKFGIWIEPEMVSPKSDLYQKHPDWIIKQPKRPEKLYRNQLVLDLSNPKVQDFVFGIVDNLFIKNPKLAYIKWDCNAVIYNAYSSYLSNQSHLYLEYVKGLYQVLEKIRAKYPKVPMMLCSGGGGRVDYAALKYFTEFWPSDNTDPLERIFIQWEYSYFYPASSSSNHVTDWGKQSLKFKTDVAMMGKLGFDIDISKLDGNELKFCQQAISNYNGFKDIIWHGEQYRLSDPWKNDVAAIMYSSTDQTTAIVFNFLINGRYDAGSKNPLKFKGLNLKANYKIAEINLFPNTKTNLNTNFTYTGDFLMEIGYNPNIDANRKSVILKVEEVK